MIKPSILVVDDDPQIVTAMQMALKDSRYELAVATTGDECLRLVRQNPLRYAVVFLDHNLPVKLDGRNAQGDFVAHRLKEINSEIMVVMVSGDRSPEAFRSWLGAGVDQYLYKPFQAHHVVAIAESGCSKYEVTFGKASNQPIQRNSEASEALRKVKMISASPIMGQVAMLVGTFAQNNYNVLTLGETGTGKELIAKGIHSLSDARNKPYLPINCSAYKNSETLLESELFGHEKGAFTGADKLKQGIFEAAQGGVVFLDEIHHLGPNAQAKLLRVVQERKVRRVGGNTEIPVKFRLIAAGKPELKEMSLQGLFTSDLFYRIKELLIELPPLRERKEDIPLLVRHFKSIYEHELNRQVEFLDSTLEVLQRYEWPGNVRELDNVIKGLMVTTKGTLIRPQDLPKEISLDTGNIFFRNGKLIPFNLLINEQENQQRQLILKALEETKNNVSQAAQKLEIARSTMRDLMKKFKIEETLLEIANKK